MESLIKFYDLFVTILISEHFLITLSFLVIISVFFGIFSYFLLKAEVAYKHSITLEKYFTHKNPVVLIRTYPDVCLKILTELKTERDALENKLQQLQIRGRQ